MPEVIKVEGISKRYRLGTVSVATMRQDLFRWWNRLANGRGDSELEGLKNAKLNGQYVWALKDVSFSVNQGDKIGIIGRNGAGKSTLLKILSRVTEPTSGRAMIVGKLASLLEVGTGFHPELSGRENIFLNGAVLGMKKREILAKFDEIVDFSGVETYIDTPVKRYSSGMYVRLAFAVAAHLNPEILIIDEVLAVGDASFQAKCLGKMDDISNEGRTILFVSHNLQAISQLCNRAIFIEKGVKVFEGNTAETIEKYTSVIMDGTHLMDANLKDRMNRTSGTCRVTRFSLSDTNGTTKSEFGEHESVVINMELEAFQNLKSLGIFVSFKTLMQRETITSFKKGILNEPVEQGKKIKVEMRIDNVMVRPGEYIIYVAIGDYSVHHCFDVVDQNVDIPLLRIVSDKTDPHLLVGYFNQNCEFTFKML